MHHIIDHWFWFLITMACVVWYSTITIYVAIRGVFDIKHMLTRLSDKQSQDVNSDNNNVKL
ncbi:MAG: hypothetical protein PHR77_18935 [Kiritimatiellae bacterium]|nr:hypothetical protein [Kiritimatiellia bacterium]MDD5521413.1 hypothetical protein [Kiritimatiellia bacterium]